MTVQIPSREVVEAVCEQAGYRSNGLAYSDQVWIKYSAGMRLAEATMQRYVHAHADPRIVRIPQVYDAFTVTFQPTCETVTYIVMENIQGADCAAYRKWDPEVAEAAITAIATAVRHLWEIPPPPNATPGPLDGENPVDRFFSDFGADRVFNDLVELEDWVNGKLKKAGRPDRVALQGEPLSLCHGDLTQWNVKLGEPAAIIDFGFSGFYPRMFEEFALVHQFSREGHTFAKALHRRLFGPKLSPPMRALSLAARYHMFRC